MYACLASQPPKELRNAFWGAIGAYNDWHPRQPEPEVSLHQQPTVISSICDSVGKHDGPMPNGWLHLEMVTRGSEQLPEDRSSDRRMGRASNNGGISLERGSALHDPAPGLHLRCGRHTRAGTVLEIEAILPPDAVVRPYFLGVRLRLVWDAFTRGTLFDGRVHNDYRRARSPRPLTCCLDGERIASLMSSLRSVLEGRHVDLFQLAV